MSVSFHDGTSASFSGYCARPWDDLGMLMLNPDASEYDKKLMDNHNTKAGIRTLLTHERIEGCYPFGVGKPKMSVIVASGDVDVMVLKGLHQWRKLGKSWNYELHMTLGFEGAIWHLYCIFGNAAQKAVPSGDITKGDYVAPVSHDGWVKV